MLVFGIVCVGQRTAKIFKLWRNTALKKFGVELRAGVELGGTL